MKVKFVKDKETKNAIRYAEVPESGKPPIVGSIYLQRWFADDRDEIEVDIPEAKAAGKK